MFDPTMRRAKVSVASAPIKTKIAPQTQSTKPAKPTIADFCTWFIQMSVIKDRKFHSKEELTREIENEALIFARHNHIQPKDISILTATNRIIQGSLSMDGSLQFICFGEQHTDIDMDMETKSIWN